MGPGPPTVPGLDTQRLDELRDLEPGDTTYLDRAIDNFEVNSRNAVEAVRVAVAEGDLDTAATRAHKIAGSALNLGAPRAGEAARATEVAARFGVVDPSVTDELDDAMSEARELLRRYQGTYR